MFKLSQCRVYMEIPRAMSPTKVPGIELNITVAQSWSSNRLPMVKWKYSWWNVCIFPWPFLVPTLPLVSLRSPFALFDHVPTPRVVNYVYILHVRRNARRGWRKCLKRRDRSSRSFSCSDFLIWPSYRINSSFFREENDFWFIFELEER